MIYALTKLKSYLQGAEFVIITNHKPLKSLFLRDIKKTTRVQRWTVLLAEYAATIEYRNDSNNVRADFCSRLKLIAPHPPPILAVETVALCELEFDDPEPDALTREQRGMMEYELGAMLQDDYILHGDICSIR